MEIFWVKLAKSWSHLTDSNAGWLFFLFEEEHHEWKLKHDLVYCSEASTLIKDFKQYRFLLCIVFGMAFLKK
jgi:hypothetical protein